MIRLEKIGRYKIMKGFVCKFPIAKTVGNLNANILIRRIR